MKVILSIAAVGALAFGIWVVATSIVTDIQLTLAAVSIIGALLLFGTATIIGRLDEFRGSSGQ